MIQLPPASRPRRTLVVLFFMTLRAFYGVRTVKEKRMTSGKPFLAAGDEQAGTQRQPILYQNHCLDAQRARDHPTTL